MSKEINLTQGYKSLVDDEDYEKFSKFKWKISKSRGKIYATRNFSVYGKFKAEILHRIIINCPKGMQVDHINGNTLDNRKCNLRICTVSQNQMNAGKHGKGTSKYKGVNFRKSSNKWVVRIQYNKQRINLGDFETQEEAAKTYNEAALKYHGEFARLNEIPI